MMSVKHFPLTIPISSAIKIHGDLKIPQYASNVGAKKGLVLFAHGSGSGRFSPRNQYVADRLNNSGLATLLVDLLTEEEERIDNQTMHLRFDIAMLADRLVSIVQWIKEEKVHQSIGGGSLKDYKIGLFGASTGGGAALIAAVKSEKYKIDAVVSRGGRPDLAGRYLPMVTCPSLLLVGGLDAPVIEMNKEALSKMKSCQIKQLKIIPGATHLFEEKGKLEEVSSFASQWFSKYLLDVHDEPISSSTSA